MTLKNQISNGVRSTWTYISLFWEKIHSSFLHENEENHSKNQIEKFSGKVISTIITTYLWTHLHLGPSPRDSPPIDSWFLLVATNHLWVRWLSLGLSLELKFIRIVCWGSSFSPWIPRSWLHFIALKTSSLLLPDLLGLQGFRICRNLLCRTFHPVAGLT